ncbi:MAG: hypothetical protein QXF05_02165, partial [Thermofilaceae archaeon]
MSTFKRLVISMHVAVSKFRFSALGLPLSSPTEALSLYTYHEHLDTSLTGLNACLVDVLHSVTPRC